MKLSFAPALAALAALTFNSGAASLTIGDPAPDLKVSKWVKGSPVTGFETGKVYVVEFWATWCGPCRQSIPHLTEIAHQFNSKATFVGVDVWENDEKAVAKFVNGMGEKMDYTVGIDTADTFMANQWMKAAGQGGIPTAFIVNQSSRIAWIGHPMAGLDKALAKVVEGKWDLAQAKKRAAAEVKMQNLYNEAMKGTDEETLQKMAKEIELLDKEIGGIDPDQPFDGQKFLSKARFNAAMSAYQKAVFAGEDSAKIEKLKAAAKAAAPEGFDFEKATSQINLRLGAQKAQKLFKDYVSAVADGSDKDKIADLGGKVSQLQIKDPQTLNDFAWTLLTDERIKERDLPLATKLAKAAVDASEAKDAAILDTYARALFDSGKVAEAVDYQKRAVAACDNDEEKSSAAEVLKKYEAAAASKK